ncbi:phosphotransferase family enzyme [Stackebrandtia endophytica]|uniref:Phosphotransferase family enzyme n=1 Tax=Stackebrandtia endophytica TaxID=1496996 RepID=A0A543AW09_9ACTN|nr:phosphotransferase [Stackebrandtia endophytica]TQL76741.1 phosphotransferase family enzyme [Stackebrandtia endophytica]
MVDEEVLTGGNMEPVVKVGDTVRRVTGPWTPAVHDLLRRFESMGITETPRAQGIDEQGREVLSFIPGRVMADLPPPSLWRHSLLRSAGGLLRRLHDASAPLVSMEATWRQEVNPPVEVICHNDFAPYNLIVGDDELVGVIDFDMASPGSRLRDLSYLAYRLVPYAEDAPGYDPERHGTRDRRLAVLIEAYGGDYSPDAVRQAAALRLEDLAVFTDDRAETTSRSDFIAHAAMYRRDAERLRSVRGG